MQNKHILFFVDDFKGGAGNVVQILSSRLSQKGYTVTICCLCGETPGRHDLTGVEVLRTHIKGNKIKAYPKYVQTSRKVILQKRPDCVISFLFGVSTFVNLAMAGMHIPLITSERSDPNYVKPAGFMKYLLQRAYKRAKAIVVLFDAFHNLEQGKYLDKAVTIPNPVPACANPGCCRHEGGLRFVTIANDSPLKGLDILIDAFTSEKVKATNAELRIYGAYHGDTLTKKIKDAGMEDRIIQMGYTLEVNKALEWADVYVMPSRHEGFPNSLCEAMAAGKACIATECHAGIGELIHDGVNGCLVPTENPDAIAEAVCRLANAPEKVIEYGSRAVEISDRYSTENIVNQWDNLIQSVIRSC